MAHTATVRALHASAANAYDLTAIRSDFPILGREVYGKPLIYLDSGASAQKPHAVVEAMARFMESDYANVHRGLHYLSGAATDAFEAARETVRAHINARSAKEIVFTKSATEAINLVAASYGRQRMGEGDEVVVSVMEHHANIVPWHLLRAEKGVVLKVAPIDDDGNLLVDELERLIGPRTKLVAITHVSNVLGTVTPAKRIVEMAHARGVPVLFDGSQGAVHLPVDVQDLGADFYAFTGHKLYGPTGIGVLYGRQALLEEMPPYQGGGDMIRSVSFDEVVFAEPPGRFEAGTPPIVEAIGLAAAIDYVNGIGLERIAAHEHDLLRYATERLEAIQGLRIIGRANGKASIVSFLMDCAHAHDIATIIDRAGVAVRAGHHCAQPLMQRYDVAATTRASFGLYNSRAEIDVLADALQRVRELFS